MKASEERREFAERVALYIAPGLWARLDDDGKNYYMCTVALYLHFRSRNPRADIYDWQSYKKALLSRIPESLKKSS